MIAILGLAFSPNFPQKIVCILVYMCKFVATIQIIIRFRGKKVAKKGGQTGHFQEIIFDVTFFGLFLL